MIAYIVLSLSLVCFSSSYAEHTKNADDYSLEFGINSTFLLYKKKQVTLPNGLTVTQLKPIKKLPEGLQIEKESSQEIRNKIYNKYAFSLAFELAVIAVLFIAKQSTSSANNLDYACFDILETITKARLTSTVLGLGHDMYVPRFKITKTTDADARQQAAQFFKKETY